MGFSFHTSVALETDALIQIRRKGHFENVTPMYVRKGKRITRTLILHLFLNAITVLALKVPQTRA